MSSEPNKKQAIAIGIVAIVLGAGTAAAIYLHPQALYAPAWVANAAVATFPLAGAALIAGALGARRLVPCSSAARPPILRAASVSASARYCAFSSSCY